MSECALTLRDLLLAAHCVDKDGLCTQCKEKVSDHPRELKKVTSLTGRKRGPNDVLSAHHWADKVRRRAYGDGITDPVSDEDYSKKTYDLHEACIEVEEEKIAVLGLRIVLANTAGAKWRAKGSDGRAPSVQPGSAAASADSAEPVVRGQPKSKAAAVSKPQGTALGVRIGDLWEETDAKTISLEEAMILHSIASSRTIGLRAILSVTKRSCLPFIKASTSIGTEWLWKTVAQILLTSRINLREPPRKTDPSYELGVGVALGHDLTETYKTLVHDVLNTQQASAAKLYKLSAAKQLTTLSRQVSAASPSAEPDRTVVETAKHHPSASLNHHHHQDSPANKCSNCKRTGHVKAECRAAGGGSFVPAKGTKGKKGR